MKLKYEDVSDLIPYITKRGIEKLNDRIKEKMINLGLIPECKDHSPVFMKLANISSPEFETNQYGFKCCFCGTRLHPETFVKYDVSKHSGRYSVPKFLEAKSGLDLAKEMLT